MLKRRCLRRRLRLKLPGIAGYLYLLQPSIAFCNEFFFCNDFSLVMDFPLVMSLSLVLGFSLVLGALL